MSIWDVNEMLFDQAPDMFEQLGGTFAVTITRQSELRSQSGIPVSSLFAESAAAAGDVAVRLWLGSSSQMRLTGKLLANTALTIGGRQYAAVGADVTVSANVVTATLDHGLEADVADGDAVPLSPGPRFAFEGCLINYARDEELRPSQLPAATIKFQCVVSVPMKDAPTDPRINDIVELPGGKVGRIDLEPLVTNGGFWDCRIVG